MKKISSLLIAGSLAFSTIAGVAAAPVLAPGQVCSALKGMAKTRCMRGAVNAMQMSKMSKHMEKPIVRKHYKRGIIEMERKRQDKFRADQEMKAWKASSSAMSSSSSSAASTSSGASSSAASSTSSSASSTSSSSSVGY